ncbi:MAG TPA: ATP-dependent RNA helicase [Deltaproteobacteria bacterium]|nr:ATP-dependent RNA helicase [Deltaproteobacteria bacterium]
MEITSFRDLGLSKEVQRAIADLGFEEPTPVQAGTIPVILTGRDIIGQAQTGTGKTVAFGIPIVESIKPRAKGVQAIILCPTRELAIQVAEDIKQVAKYRRDIGILPVYGGQPIERQLRALSAGVQIVIGTPGRTIDHINRGTLRLNSVRMVVMDEADEMLNMGFLEDVEKILQVIPSEHQTLLFSATMPKPILSLTSRYLKEPEHVRIVHKELTVPAVQQHYYEVRETQKPEVLSRAIDMHGLKLSLVFCNTKKKVDAVVMEMQARGYLVEGLHGDLTQSQRDRVMDKFRKGALDMLVATDVAARGLDVEGIEAVFNYDVPQDEEYYVHRIGRTARAGRTGHAFSFVVGREIYQLREIERFAHIKISRKPVPSLTEVEETRSVTLLEKVRESIEEGDLERYTGLVERLVREDYSTLDVAAALLKMMVATDAKGPSADMEEPLEDERRFIPMARLSVNVGRKDKVAAKDVVGAIAGETGLPGKLIGKIEIRERLSIVEIPEEYAYQVVARLQGKFIKGHKIRVEQTTK